MSSKNFRDPTLIVSIFLFVVMLLNVAGFIVREYLVITAQNEESRWQGQLFSGAHLTVALCAFMIWRGKRNALYLLLSITLLVIVVDLAMTQLDPSHHPSIPDLILAVSESVILLILLKPWKSVTSDL